MTTTASLAMLTHAQKRALKWLRNRHADGLFDVNGVLVAAGERAPVMRSTWIALERAGVVERYGGIKRRRLRITPIGLTLFSAAQARPFRAGTDLSTRTRRRSRAARSFRPVLGFNVLPQDINRRTTARADEIVARAAVKECSHAAL